MATKSLLKTGYKRCTRAQLITLIKRYKKELISVANASEWKTFPGGRTQLQYAQAIKKQLRTVSLFLRATTLKEIKFKINVLKRQMAKNFGVAMSHPSTRSVAVKRLEAKYKDIQRCKTISKLVVIVKGLKLAKFKNPKFVGVKGGVGVTTWTNTGTRKTVSKSRKGSAYGKTSYAATTKYRTESKKLKREIQNLKSRNASLRKLVVKFRQEAAKVQRHYSTLNRTAPKWTVIKGGAVGKDVSNIVRMSNALTNAIDTRKVG